MKKIFRIVLVGFISLLVTAVTTSSESVGLQAISVIASGIFGLMVSSIYEFVDTHDQGLKTWFDTQIRYREKNIRLSFSYLFCISSSCHGVISIIFLISP